jgi:hypothetical protein
MKHIKSYNRLTHIQIDNFLIRRGAIAFVEDDGREVFVKLTTGDGFTLKGKDAKRVLDDLGFNQDMADHRRRTP